MIATLRRRKSHRKPAAARRLARTSESITTCASAPCEPSTVETCTPPYASFVHGDAATYTSECRYCLAAGDYELHTYDEWGDGWGAGLYTLAMEGCDELAGGAAPVAPCNSHVNA